MIFNGYSKDINNSFKNVFGHEPKTTDELNMVNIVLFSLLKSYFFEGNYKNVFIGYTDEGKTSLSYLSNKKMEESKIGKEQLNIQKYLKKNNILNIEDIDINELPERHSSFNDIENSKLTKFQIDKLPADCSPIIEDLIRDKKYSVLFEQSKIKQDIILKTKKDYTYTVVPQNNIDEFLNESFKIQNLNIDDKYKCLKDNYDFRFLSKEYNSSKDNNNDKYTISKHKKNNRNYYVIAHNEYEIAGICPVNQNLNFKNLIKNEDFFNVTSVMVSSNARGQGIGVKLFEKAMEESAKRNIYLVRTSATEQGRNFLKNSIDKLSILNNIPVIDADYVNELYIPIRKIFEHYKDKEKAKIVVIDLLKEIKDYQLKTVQKKKESKSIDDIYEAENDEKKFINSLEHRSYGIKKIINKPY